MISGRSGATTILSHLPYLLLCLCMGGFAWYLSAVHYGASMWADAADYAVVAKAILLEQRFPLAAVPYQEFLASGTASYGPQHVFVYPNVLFSLATGFIGLYRNDFSLLNGIYLNSAFSLLFAATTYGLAFSVLRSKGLATVFSGLVLLFVYGHLGQPLTDTSLLLFLCLSMWAMLQGHPLAAGAALGLGYLFREQALLFFPLLPLLQQQSFSLRGYGHALLRMAICFLPCIILAKAATFALLADGEFSDFYLTTTSERIQLTMQGLLIFFEHLLETIRFLFVPLIFIGYFFLRKQYTPLCLKLTLVPLIHCTIVCMLWNYKELPLRYMIYAFPFLFLAVLISLQKTEKKFLVLLALFLISLFPQRIDLSRKVRAALGPEKSLAATAEVIHAPKRLRELFPAGSVILGMHGQFAALILEDCIPVECPSFDEFRRGNNSGLDGIVLRRERNGWGKQQIIEDAHGTRFERIILHGVLVPQDHTYFKRVSNPGEKI